MDHSVNTRPLLQGSESDSDFEESKEYQVRRCKINDSVDDSSIVISKETRSLFKINEPIDRYYLAYIIFYLLGMTTLMPWTFFITAEEYWMFKFRNVGNSTAVDQKTNLQIMFVSYLSVATSVPNTLILILNTFLSQRIPLKIRMQGSMVIMLAIFITTTVFVKIDTDQCASAILSGGLFGIVGKFSPTYITAVVSGQALSGIFAAIAEILSLTFSVSPVFSAFVYFMVANVTLFFSIIAYMLLSRSLFFKYHTIDKVALAEFEASSSCTINTISYRAIFKKVWLYGFSICMVFIVSLSIFPSVTVLIESQHQGSGSLWTDVYFIPVVCYLLFSMGDYFGRIFACVFQWPMNGWIIALLNVLRIGFIPLLMLCNAQPRHYLPVLIPYDYYYILIMACFALSNGYLVNIAMINAPKIVEPHEKEVASSMMAAFLGIGLAIGSALSLVTVELL